MTKIYCLIKSFYIKIYYKLLLIILCNSYYNKKDLIKQYIFVIFYTSSVEGDETMTNTVYEAFRIFCGICAASMLVAALLADITTDAGLKENLSLCPAWEAEKNTLSIKDIIFPVAKYN